MHKLLNASDSPVLMCGRRTSGDEEGGRWTVYMHIIYHEYGMLDRNKAL